MRWHGIVCGVPLAAGSIVLVELTRVPLSGDPRWAMAALGQLARGAVTTLALPALLLLLTALVLAWTERQRGRRHRIGMAALFGLGLSLSGLVREVLIEHPPFAWSLPANAGFVVLGVFFGVAFAWLGAARLERHRRATQLAGAGVAALSLVLARGHYAFYVGLYPTLHACALTLAFALLALGVALASAPDARLPRMAALALVLPLALLAVLDLPGAAEARPFVMAYTELGRVAGVARALERDAAHLLPDSLPAPRVDPLLEPDPDALSRFAAHSGLPPLGIALKEHDVLLVMSDTTRFDRTSLARPGGPTPNLEAFAEEALVFERAYAPSNGTFPSLASMLAMTPVSFAELDVQPRFWRGALRDERKTAPEAMREAGRATFWVGHDHARCFSDHIRGLEQGFETRTLIEDAPDADVHIATAAIDAIRAHRAAGRRYFGLVFFGSPHDEYVAHDPSAPGETDLERYDQELAFMDRAFGRVLDALEEDGALASTVVVFASDHGEAFGERGHRFHLSSVHDEQIHVPLVVRIAGVPGARLSRPTSTAYVLPWLLARGAAPEREAAEHVLREDIGPLMRALDGAVVSEMIGPRSQAAALVWDEHVVVYDVLADLVRIYDARDVGQERDLREERPDLIGHFAPLAARYRRARFAGRRFRFIEAPP